MKSDNMINEFGKLVDEFMKQPKETLAEMLAAVACIVKCNDPEGGVPALAWKPSDDCATVKDEKPENASEGYVFDGLRYGYNISGLHDVKWNHDSTFQG